MAGCLFPVVCGGGALTDRGGGALTDRGGGAWVDADGTGMESADWTGGGGAVSGTPEWGAFFDTFFCSLVL